MVAAYQPFSGHLMLNPVIPVQTIRQYMTCRICLRHGMHLGLLSSQGARYATNATSLKKNLTKKREMPNVKTFRCIVDLHIKAVSAPGIRLPRKDRLYLSVFMFGQYKITKLVKRNLPLIFEEKFQFDKIFFDQTHPDDIVNINLKDQMVLIELIQRSHKHGAFQLATYCDSALSFLYPYLSLTPVYADTQRELLMTRASECTGISPKLEFQVNTKFYEEPLMSIKDSLEGLQDTIKSIQNDKRKRGSKVKGQKKFKEHESHLIFGNGLAYPVYTPRKQIKSEWFSIEELDRDLTGTVCTSLVESLEDVCEVLSSKSVHFSKNSRMRNFIKTESQNK